MSSDITITARLVRVVRRSERDGRSAVLVCPDARFAGRKGIPREGNLLCFGVFLTPYPTERLSLTGHLEDRVKGRCFVCSRVEEKNPETISALESYLSSGIIAGLDGQLAHAIVQKFGIETLKIIEEDPEQLLSVEGLNESLEKKIRETWNKQVFVQELMEFLQSLDLSPELCLTIFNTYGFEARNVVEQNPYRLALDIPGIRFSFADELARKQNREEDSSLRLELAVLLEIKKASERGDVFIEQAKLFAACEELLDVEEKDLEAIVQKLERKHSLVCEELESPKTTLVFSARLHELEAKSAFYLKRLLKPAAKIVPKKTQCLIEESIAHPNFPDTPHFSFHPTQEEALRKAAESKVMVLTGGPGTGKTTIIRALIAAFQKQTEKILLAAPTGRAAQRMTETTGMTAQTLHRLLEFNPIDGRFCRNEHNTLDCDVLIVDESSMIDIELFCALVRAIPIYARFILVGDVFQLPSVGPGSVLSDVIASGIVPVSSLSCVYRQGASSKIVSYAHQIKDGEMPSFTLDKGEHSDIYFLQKESAVKTAETITGLVQERLPNYFHFDPFTDIQVLCPMHKGEAGSDRMNSLLQSALNPQRQGVEEFVQGNRLFRVGDKVMQVKNNYEKDVFNGDIGRIASIKAEQEEFSVLYDEGKEVTYSYSDLDEIVLAYAISIHKSQGSEYPAVVMPILVEHRNMLQRNLIYTGITRGKKLVVIVGEKEAMRQAVENNRSRQRNTRLAWRLSQKEEEKK